MQATNSALLSMGCTSSRSCGGGFRFFKILATVDLQTGFSSTTLVASAIMRTVHFACPSGTGYELSLSIGLRHVRQPFACCGSNLHPYSMSGLFPDRCPRSYDQGVESLNGNTIPVAACWQERRFPCLLSRSNRIRHLVTTVLDVLFERSTFLMLLTCSSVNSIEMVFLLISANYLFVIAQRYEDFRSLQNK